MPTEVVSGWRVAVLEIVLRWAVRLGGLVAITFIVTSYVFHVDRFGTFWFWVPLLSYGLLVAVRYFPSLPFSARAVGLCAVCYIAGTSASIHVGLAPGAILALALGVVCAGLFAQRSIVLAMLALSTATVALGIHAGWHTGPSALAPINPQYWLRYGIGFAAFTAMMAILIAHVVQRLERSLQESNTALERLRAEELRRQDAQAALRDTEEALLRSQKMEAVGRLAAGVGHDFNNALQVVVAWTSLLRSAQEPELVAEALDAIERAARQGSDLTKRLLSLGRPEIHAPRVLALGDAARELGASLKRLMPEHIDLQVEIRDTPSVLFDPAQLDQVLLNLCVNAKDAMPQGGSLQIGLESASTSDLSARTGRSLEGVGWAHLWVTDSGAGMGADVVEHIFEPFFTTKGEHGTGLGLAAVRAIVEQNDGFIEVESEPGSGTTFHVYLPETSDLPSSTRLPASMPQTAKAAVVLLAEDDIDVRAALARALSRSGFTVLQCGDADSAREILAQRRANVDVLCTDGIMPGGGTGTLIDEYLGAYPAGKVILCSGYVQEDLRVRETQSESVSFLPKPFAPSDLIERIRLMRDG